MAGGEDVWRAHDIFLTLGAGVWIIDWFRLFDGVVCIIVDLYSLYQRDLCITGSHVVDGSFLLAGVTALLD